MRKILFLFVLICSYAQAAMINGNVFSLSTYEFEQETTQKVYVHMDVGEAYTGFQFDLYLPEGVSIITKGKDRPKIYEDGPWGEDDVTLSCTQRANGSYRFLEYANVGADKPQAGTGYIIELNVQTAADAPVGPCLVEFKTIELSTLEHVAVRPDDIAYDAMVIGAAATYSISASSADESMGSVEISGGGESVAEGTEVTVTATAAEGYEFVNWTSEGNEVSTENPYTFAASGDIALVANFKAKKYDVTFVFGNGTEDYIQSLDFGTVIPRPEDPTKTGYTFAGWDPAFEDGATVPVGGITYTAVWTLNQYKLTYMLDGELYKEFTIDFGAAIEAEPAPVKEGYTFSGWEGLPETMPASDVTVTGSFAVNTYKLTYKVDGETYKEYNVAYGTAIEAEPAPVKEGYTFSGWERLPETMPANDVTVTGSFAVNTYKLTYKVDGETYKEYNVAYGAAITAEAAPVKEGYTFSGWEGLPETMPAHDVVVTGSFAVNSYEAVFKIGDDVIAAKTIEYGKPVVAPDAPEKEGYTFAGWQDVPETMPAHDIVVLGSYTVNTYKLTYEVDGETYKEYNVEYGAAITAEAAPEKEGYTFSGWEGLPETMPAHDVTVSGTFSVNSYRLSLYLNDELYYTEMIEFGAPVTVNDPEVPEGNKFDGWLDEIPATMPAHDVNIYGKYSPTVSIALVGVDNDTMVTIYNLSGRLVCKDVRWDEVCGNLKNGFYIINGAKCLIRR